MLLTAVWSNHFDGNLNLLLFLLLMVVASFVNLFSSLILLTIGLFSVQAYYESLKYDLKAQVCSLNIECMPLWEQELDTTK